MLGLTLVVVLLCDGQIGGIAVPPLVTGVACVAVAFLLQYTVFGPMLYVTGGNEEAARLAGIDTRRVKIGAFCLADMLAGIAGPLLTRQIQAGRPTLGAGLERQAVAAAVAGGIALAGGRGTVGGVALGVVLLTILQNGLDLTNTSSYWQQIVMGLVIVLTLMSDYLRRRAHGAATEPA